MYKRPKPRTKYIGVYGIRHKPSGQMYVGASSDITGRWTHHRFMLRANKHKTQALQTLWLLNHEKEFEFVTLERCDLVNLKEKEQQWLDKTPISLNTLKTINGIGRKYQSLKLSLAAKRRWARQEYREKRLDFLSVRNRGRFVGQDKQ